jgi:hypothetical protein
LKARVLFILIANLIYHALAILFVDEQGRIRDDDFAAVDMFAAAVSIAFAGFTIGGVGTYASHWFPSPSC